MALSTRLNEPPDFDPTASMAATVASGVLPFRPELRPDSITRFVISFVCSGSPADRSTSIATCFADSRRIRFPRIGAPFRCQGQGVPAPLARLYRVDDSSIHVGTLRRGRRGEGLREL